jgi:hypothetical protein
MSSADALAEAEANCPARRSPEPGAGAEIRRADGASMEHIARAGSGLSARRLATLGPRLIAILLVA